MKNFCLDVNKIRAEKLYHKGRLDTFITSDLFKWTSV